MAEITASAVKELRELSGAGMMDCKAALTETKGDVQAAVDWLRNYRDLSQGGRTANSLRAKLQGVSERLLVTCRTIHEGSGDQDRIGRGGPAVLRNLQDVRQ